MSPIKGLSEQLRMPRIGKIHLGIKKQNAKGVEYPSATDYFVCPPEIMKVYGEQPKSLPIIIPVEDGEYWASQYYRAYSQTRGLICKGDGEKCQRMIDTNSGDIAGKDTKEVVWKEGTCEGRECLLYGAKRCSEMMCLQFMLPDVPGVGVWQIDTGSINSIRNINSEAALIKSLCGRIAMIPLLLTLEQQGVINPDDGKKKNVHVMHLRQRETLQTLLSDSQKPIYELLAPPVDEAQAARDIEELWPEGNQKAIAPTEAATKPQPKVSSQAKKSQEKAIHQHTDVTTSDIPPRATQEQQVKLRELVKDGNNLLAKVQEWGWPPVTKLGELSEPQAEKLIKEFEVKDIVKE